MELGIFEEISDAARELVRLCVNRGLKITTAESCTGGMVSAAITSVPGSSEVFELGVCAYSDRVKKEILGADEGVIDDFSVYSAQCAEEMAKRAGRLSGADLAVSTTGVAGPGAVGEHPQGEVFISAVGEGVCLTKRFLFFGKRDEVRAKACLEALRMLYEIIVKN